MSGQDIARTAETLVWPNGELVDIESIEGYAEDARMVAHPLDDNQIRTPDWVIEQLADTSRWASRMVKVIRMAEALKQERKDDLDDLRAKAVIDVAGYPAREQASRVLIATKDARRAYHRAQVAFEEARRVGNLLVTYSSRLQSIGRQVELTYRHGGGQ
jgi:hypothetical protein